MAISSLTSDLSEALWAVAVLEDYMARDPIKGRRLKKGAMTLSSQDKAFVCNYDRKAGVVYAQMSDELISLFVKHGAVKVPEINHA